MQNNDNKKSGSIKVLVVVTIALVLIANALAIFYFGIKAKENNNTKEPTTTIIAPPVEETTAPAAEIITEPETIPAEKIKLCDMTCTDGIFIKESEIKDTVGNIYTKNVGRLNHVDGTKYAIFYLGGNYKSLNGTLAISYNSDKGCSSNITIYADDEPLFETGSIDRVYAPVELELSVEGVQWIKIESSNGNIVPILADWTFE